MADVEELSAADLSVAERMAQLPASMLGLEPEEGEDLRDPKAGQERSDEPEAPDEVVDEPPKAAAEEDEPDAAEADPEFEIPDADGGEPERVKLSELVEAKNQLAAIKGREAEVLERVHTQAHQAATQRIQQVDAWMNQTAFQLQQGLALLPQIAPPPFNMLNPSSPNYDPDQYHLQKGQFDQLQAHRHAIGQQLQGIQQQQLQMAEAQTAQREEAELRQLAVKRSDWIGADGEIKLEVADRLVNGLQKHFGVDPELSRSVIDHSFFLVADAALQFAEMKEKGGTVQARAVAKAPAKAQSSDAKAGRTLGREEAQHMQARGALKKSGKTEDAARAFMKYV